jgi:hypothetical protein
MYQEENQEKKEIKREIKIKKANNQVKVNLEKQYLNQYQEEVSTEWYKTTSQITRLILDWMQ